MPYTSPAAISRRFLCAGLGALALIGAAPGAGAQPPLRLPNSIAYMRFSEDGAEALSPPDRTAWEQMARRLGPMIERMEPFEYSTILPMPAPIRDGGASAALHARTMAARAGYGYVLLYAVIPPQAPETPAQTVSPERVETTRSSGSMRHVRNRVNWVFSSLSQTVGGAPAPEAQAQIHRGEAHLIDAMGGGVVVSVWSQAPQNRSLGIFREKTDPEAAILNDLVEQMERRVQMLSRESYRNGRSIAG